MKLTATASGPTPSGAAGMGGGSHGAAVLFFCVGFITIVGMTPRPPDAEIVQILMQDLGEVISIAEAELLRSVFQRDFRRTTDAQTALRRRLAEIRTDRLRERPPGPRSRVRAGYGIPSFSPVLWPPV